MTRSRFTPSPLSRGFVVPTLAATILAAGCAGSASSTTTPQAAAVASRTPDAEPPVRLRDLLAMSDTNPSLIMRVRLSEVIQAPVARGVLDELIASYPEARDSDARRALELAENMQDAVVARYEQPGGEDVTLTVAWVDRAVRDRFAADMGRANEPWRCGPFAAWRKPSHGYVLTPDGLLVMGPPEYAQRVCERAASGQASQLEAPIANALTAAGDHAFVAAGRPSNSDNIEGLWFSADVGEVLDATLTVRMNDASQVGIIAVVIRGFLADPSRLPNVPPELAPLITDVASGTTLDQNGRDLTLRARFSADQLMTLTRELITRDQAPADPAAAP